MPPAGNLGRGANAIARVTELGVRSRRGPSNIAKVHRCERTGMLSR